MQLPGLTKRAAQKISLITLKVTSDLPDRDQYLPVVQWTTENTAEPNFVPGLGLGLHRRADIPPEYIIEAHGIQLVCWLPDEMIERFKDAFIDYIEGRFIFIDAAMKKILQDAE